MKEDNKNKQVVDNKPVSEKDKLVEVKFFAPTPQANVLRAGDVSYVHGELAHLNKETIDKLNAGTSWTVTPVAELKKETKK